MNMTYILSKNTASITELRSNPTALIEKAKSGAIAILNRNTPAAYLISQSQYKILLDALDEFELIKKVKSRKKDLSKAVKVGICEFSPLSGRKN
jgi:antitoxin StbD